MHQEGGSQRDFDHHYPFFNHCCPCPSWTGLILVCIICAFHGLLASPPGCSAPCPHARGSIRVLPPDLVLVWHVVLIVEAIPGYLCPLQLPHIVGLHL